SLFSKATPKLFYNPYCYRNRRRLATVDLYGGDYTQSTHNWLFHTLVSVAIQSLINVFIVLFIVSSH
uniref:Uncharacterized protein n=1 Tax=Neogobius melanostomus TaxID=47308 RepID=A0A8C6SQ61_9GOBI